MSKPPAAREGDREGRGGFAVYGTPMTIVDKNAELATLTAEVTRLKQRTAAVRERNESDVTRLGYVGELVGGVLAVLDLGSRSSGSVVSDLEVIREQVSGRQVVIRRGRLEAKNLADLLAVARETIKRCINDKMTLQRNIDKLRIDHARYVQELKGEVRRYQDESRALDEHIDHMTKELQNLEALSAVRVSDNNALAASVQSDAQGHEERLRALRAESQLHRDELTRLSSLTHTLLSMLGFRDTSDKLEVALDHAFDLASVQHTKIAEASSTEETTSRLVVAHHSPVDVDSHSRLPPLHPPQSSAKASQQQPQMMPDVHLPPVDSRLASAAGVQHSVRILEESATPLPPINGQQLYRKTVVSGSTSPSPLLGNANTESESDSLRSEVSTADGASNKPSPKDKTKLSIKSSKKSRSLRECKKSKSKTDKGSRSSLSSKRRNSAVSKTTKELTPSASYEDLSLFHATPTSCVPDPHAPSPPLPCL